MLVNVSPEASSTSETVCSLRFAQQVNQTELGRAERHISSSSSHHSVLSSASAGAAAGGGASSEGSAQDKQKQKHTLSRGDKEKELEEAGARSSRLRRPGASRSGRSSHSRISAASREREREKAVDHTARRGRTHRLPMGKSRRRSLSQ